MSTFIANSSRAAAILRWTVLLAVIIAIVPMFTGCVSSLKTRTGERVNPALLDELQAGVSTESDDYLT